MISFILYELWLVISEGCPLMVCTITLIFVLLREALNPRLLKGYCSCVLSLFTYITYLLTARETSRTSVETCSLTHTLQYTCLLYDLLEWSEVIFVTSWNVSLICLHLFQKHYYLRHWTFSHTYTHNTALSDLALRECVGYFWEFFTAGQYLGSYYGQMP